MWSELRPPTVLLHGLAFAPQTPLCSRQGHLPGWRPKLCADWMTSDDPPDLAESLVSLCMKADGNIAAFGGLRMECESRAQRAFRGHSESTSPRLSSLPSTYTKRPFGWSMVITILPRRLSSEQMSGFLRCLCSGSFSATYFWSPSPQAPQTGSLRLHVLIAKGLVMSYRRSGLCHYINLPPLSPPKKKKPRRAKSTDGPHAHIALVSKKFCLTF